VAQNVMYKKCFVWAFWEKEFGQKTKTKTKILLK